MTVAAAARARSACAGQIASRGQQQRQHQGASNIGDAGTYTRREVGESGGRHEADTCDEAACNGDAHVDSGNSKLAR